MNPNRPARRTLAALALLVPTAFALMACGSGSGEETASDQSALFYQRCGVDQYLSCTGPVGRQTCTCVTGPARCVQEPAVGATTNVYPYTFGWAMVTSTGTCPPLRGSGGAWMESSNGYVPGANAPLYTDCHAAFPNSPACCTYVWWPDYSAMQDPSPLCNSTTLEYAPILQGGVPRSCSANDGDSGCGGGETCRYCAGGGPQ